jgi:hypothetical protein
MFSAIKLIIFVIEKFYCSFNWNLSLSLISFTESVKCNKLSRKNYFVDTVGKLLCSSYLLCSLFLLDFC